MWIKQLHLSITTSLHVFTTHQTEAKCDRLVKMDKARWKWTRPGENGLGVYITKNKIIWVSHTNSAVNHEGKPKKTVSSSFVSLKSWKIKYFLSSSLGSSYTLRKFTSSSSRDIKVQSYDPSPIMWIPHSQSSIRY